MYDTFFYFNKNYYRFLFFQGAYDIHDFLMDYDSLPEEGFFGKFEAKIFAVKDFVDTACLSLTVEFNELDDE